ncbi:peptide-methionine (S)-S-oxide reductase MsrA [Streptomyces sp. NPDC088354]|uniref:peptide-methionine (S)-S-oxide reductase MsrA n=1 Tax=unclassified Streptomyces TaxID=2593676 RepID=UPI0029A577FF|nr:peptide-methionine (S)-S-oxide reductase MsrA [Streptomyces sp. MI02-7b]MDX3072024.1 peptide-methionine (S)-S-oxide reductase MsrA [Streptomyces sp. MI02-7b]
MTATPFPHHGLRLPSAGEALPGRAAPLHTVPARHLLLGTPLAGPYPAGLEVADLALGCFWGAERTFWRLPGVWTTLVGYQGGHTEHPAYEEVCSGLTGHAETVRVVFDPALLPYDGILRAFWEAHDPTQGYRQGHDHGTQYRSALRTHSPRQHATALASRERYAAALHAAGHGPVTTEIAPAGPFYPAEARHQQYLAQNPAGYCGIGGTGVACPADPAGAAR